MREVRYLKVADEMAAITAGAEDDAAFIAGGTTLVDLMKLEVLAPATLVDVNGLALDQIEVGPDAIRVGALVTNSDLAYHPVVAARHPLVAEALLAGASAQIRNMATLGGNLLQRTRCPYFRDRATACNKRSPGTGCSAIGGYARNHAILGVSEHCIAAHPSDLCVALAASDAIVHVRGATGERKIPFDDFHVLPADHPEKETIVERGELVTAVSLPARPGWAYGNYVKVRDRASYAFALVSAAVALRVEGGRIRDARVALGGVGTKPWRSPAAEKTLAGKAPSHAVFAAAAQAALAEARPRKHNAFKVGLAQRTIVRALESVKGAA